MRLAAFHRSFDVDAQQQQQQLLEQQRLQQQQQGRQGMTQTVTGLAAAAAQASGAAQAKALPLSNRYDLLPVQEEATGTSSDGQQPQQQAVAPGPGCVAGEGAARRGSRLRDEDYMAAAVRFDATPPRKHRAVCQDVAATPSPGQPLATGDPDLRQFIKDLTEAAGLSKPLNPRKKVCQQARVAVGASSCPDEHAAVGGGKTGSVDVVGGSRGCERGSPEPAMPQAAPEGLQGHVNGRALCVLYGAGYNECGTPMDFLKYAGKGAYKKWKVKGGHMVATREGVTTGDSMPLGDLLRAGEKGREDDRNRVIEEIAALARHQRLQQGSEGAGAGVPQGWEVEPLD